MGILTFIFFGISFFAYANSLQNSYGIIRNSVPHTPKSQYPEFLFLRQYAKNADMMSYGDCIEPKCLSEVNDRIS